MIRCTLHQKDGLHKCLITSVPKFKNPILSCASVLDFDFDPKNKFRAVKVAKRVINQSFVQ